MTDKQSHGREPKMLANPTVLGKNMTRKERKRKMRSYTFLNKLGKQTDVQSFVTLTQ